MQSRVSQNDSDFSESRGMEGVREDYWLPLMDLRGDCFKRIRDARSLTDSSKHGRSLLALSGLL